MSPSKSLDWLVAGRGYAIMWIYIGHIMLTYYKQDQFTMVEIGVLLQTAIIPFFIVLSGAFFSIGNISYPKYAYLKFSQRIIPVIFYSLLMIPIYLLFNDKPLQIAINYWYAMILGIPLLNWPTWFLIALFMSELVYFFLYKNRWSKHQAIIIAFILYTIGWVLNSYRWRYGVMIDNLTMAWMINSVPLFLSCMIVGKAFKKDIIKFSRWPKHKILIHFILGLAVLIGFSWMNTSFPEINHGFRKKVDNDMVHIFIGQYGNFFYFLCSALAGTYCCFMLSRLIPDNKFAMFVGENSMLLLGLNAIFHQGFNWKIARALPLPADSIFWGFTYGIGIGVLSIVGLIPFTWLLKKYAPQLTGRPMLSGPILPALYKK